MIKSEVVKCRILGGEPYKVENDRELTEFIDLDEAPWAMDYIQYVTDRGLVHVEVPGSFNPNGALTREVFIQMLVMAYDLVDEGAVTSFEDVDKGSWYYKYVASAEKAGIVKGIGNGNFGSGTTITREQMATMIDRTSKTVEAPLPIINKTLPFADHKMISSYALGSVYKIQAAGLIEGIGDNVFAPKETATRAQGSKIIYLLLGGK